MFKQSLLAILLLSGSGAALAEKGALRMIAPLNQAMPLAQFSKEKLSGGILKDLGDALAQRLGRQADYISVAGDQVGAALAARKADGVCYVRPFWIDGDFHWSRPLIPDAELVASVPGAPPVRSLIDLRDRPVGTVASYRYPRMEQVLGLRFIRDNSPTMEENLAAIRRGAVQHAVLGRAILDYQHKLDPALALRADLVIASFAAQCAFIRHGNITAREIDRALDAMVADGTVDAILARYR